ncbi:hypothetical protein [Streptomyces sp. x-80]|uniref:hypothetical protein n=1 Tax=Streptomyces sp. x-80 TaxID=2789282 RepID=UPI00397F3382
MSDSRDEQVEYLLAKLTTLYYGLRVTCQGLPVSITLPRATGPISELMEGVDRCFRISDDLPLPDDVRADLQMACLHWNTAADLIGLYATGMNGSKLRDEAAELAMASMQVALNSVLAWLDQE